MSKLNQRQNDIIRILSHQSRISVKELSDKFDVSSVTVRADLAFLEDQGLALRTHGGVELPSPDDLSHRLARNYTRKNAIAERALNLVNPGDSLLLESGSCVALLARLLGGKAGLTVTTNNAFVARQLPKNRNLKVVLIGGVFQQESETMVGEMVRQYLDYLHFDKVFLGVDGILPGSGAMCRDLDRAEVMAEFVNRAEEVILLTDSSKFGRSGLKTFCTLDRVRHIVTDDAIPDDARTAVAEAGVNIIIAGENS